MRLRVIAIGTRMPDWVEAGCQEYLRRLRGSWRLELVAVAPAGRRASGGGADLGKNAEAARILAQIKPREYVAALDERGSERGSVEFSQWLEQRRASGRDLSFIIGGADGLGEALLTRADSRCSLSRLTLPHALARLLLIEQLYRASTVLAGHPYHRE